MVTAATCVAMCITVNLFTYVSFILLFQNCAHGSARIHHPFLLSDNRHYTFYVWKRIYMLHPLVPYLLVPVYIVCGWAWFLRVGTSVLPLVPEID